MIPRVVLAAAAVVLLLAPWPAPLSLAGAATLVGAAVAVWAVRAPGSLAPLVLLTTAVVSWLSAVPDPGLARIAAFAAAGYAVHSAAAISAAVPAGAPVGATLLWRWVGQTLAVLVIGWSLVAMTALVAGLPGSAGLVIVGMLAAVTFVALPAVVVRRGRP